MTDKLTANQVKSMFLYVADRVIAEKETLCDADRQIGDGDHGIGMAYGFEGAKQELESKEFDDVYSVFSTVGRKMISVMGGASGIIFGLLFFAGSKGMPPQSDINVSEFTELFTKSLAEIQVKGGAKLGDKTLVDALSPAVDAMKKCVEKGTGFQELLSEALLGAETGKEASKDYVARFGKAKTLGDRAIGYPDAGCVSMTVIFSAMKDWATSNI